ncbi:50S ribosomal protein L29 [Clostridia bacterium]|nr:50S ribosomal protein L29 [Clostridia bacterium]
MKANEIKDMTSEEIVQKVGALKQELFNLRFQAATAQLDNPMRIKEVRKDIARAKTVLREREVSQAKAM